MVMEFWQDRNFVIRLLPPNLDFPTRIPPLIFVEIRLPLLTYHLYVVTESYGKDGLVVWCCGPIEVIDGSGCAVIFPQSEETYVQESMAYSNTLLNSNPLANSLSFESQIVNSSPSSRGTTIHKCQPR